MSHTKEASKRKRRRKAVPVLGAAGVLSLAGGAASAATTAPTADMPSRDTAQRHVFLGEEEVADVSLATFYRWMFRLVACLQVLPTLVDAWAELLHNNAAAQSYCYPKLLLPKNTSAQKIPPPKIRCSVIPNSPVRAASPKSL
jgi:hypothetical protein